VIITLTLNPSLDRTMEIPALDRGDVIRATSSVLEAGGKGVNVSRALLANGIATLAVVALGGPVGDELASLLKTIGLELSIVEVAEATRSNVTLTEPDGTTTKINEAGAALSIQELSLVEETLLEVARSGDWVVLSGSLPTTVPVDTYASLVRQLTSIGVNVAVDTSGQALTQAIAAGPTLVKPNRDELGEAVGRTIDSFDDAIDAARIVQRSGARAVLVSLGADGALLVDSDVVAARCDVVQPRSTVGAGDCLLAGFLSAGGEGVEALLTAVRWASAAVALPGSGVPTSAEIVARHPDLIVDIDQRGLSMSRGGTTRQ
jgi:1-phosphofructokinase